MSDLEDMLPPEEALPGSGARRRAAHPHLPARVGADGFMDDVGQGRPAVYSDAANH